MSNPKHVRLTTISVLVAGCLLMPSQGASQNPVPSWSIQEVSRVGSLNDSIYALTEVAQALIGPDLASYVAQRMDKTIRVYGQSGEFLRTIGRRGKGPGEFDDLTEIGFKGDTLFASDQSMLRITLFESDGSVGRMATVISPMMGDSMPEILLPNVPSILLPGDVALVAAGVPIMWLERGGARMPYLKLDIKTAQLDTLHWRLIRSYVFTLMHNGRRFSALRPFPRDQQVTFAADGSGVVVVDMPKPSPRTEASFTLRKIGIDGSTIFERRIPYRPVPLPDIVLEQLLERSQIRMARTGDPPSLRAIEQTLRSNDHMPDPLPPVATLATSRDGRIWLQREPRGGPTSLWDVYSPAGDHLASVHLPAGQVVKDARGADLLTAGHDELGVPYIVRYRLLER